MIEATIVMSSRMDELFIDSKPKVVLDLSACTDAVDRLVIAHTKDGDRL